MKASDGELDAPVSPDADGPLFPVEGQFFSSADRAHIMSLPEIEREEILADRAQQVIRRQQDLQLKKALADTKAAASRHKRKAEAADLEDTTRRSTRPKTDKRTALDDYRRAREQKGAERGRLDARRVRKDERSPSTPSDRDADGESEVEWAEPSSNSRRDEPPSELRDFERCRVGRSNFAKVCFYPGFEEAIKGCFCRVSIGINRDTGQNQYRMTQIKGKSMCHNILAFEQILTTLGAGFTEGKPYQMENAAGKHFITDQYAVVVQGSAEKPWPFSACSDGRFTEAEFTRFAETLKKDNMHLPSRKFLNTKLDGIHGLLNQRFTEETLQLKFAKQRAMELKHDPVHSAKVKRDAIKKRQLEAEENGDLDEIARCDSELAALENSLANANGAYGAKLNPAKKVVVPDRLAQHTKDNRTKNIQEVRRALIEEKRKLQRDREAVAAKKQVDREARQEAAMEAARKRAADAAKEAGHGLKLPKNDLHDLFGESGTDISRAGTPANGIGTPRRSRAGTPLTGVREKGPLGALKKKVLDDDVIGNLDLGIDIDL